MSSSEHRLPYGHTHTHVSKLFLLFILAHTHPLMSSASVEVTSGSEQQQHSLSVLGVLHQGIVGYRCKPVCCVCHVSCCMYTVGVCTSYLSLCFFISCVCLVYFTSPSALLHKKKKEKRIATSADLFLPNLDIKCTAWNLFPLVLHISRVPRCLRVTVVA